MYGQFEKHVAKLAKLAKSNFDAVFRTFTGHTIAFVEKSLPTCFANVADLPPPSCQLYLAHYVNYITTVSGAKFMQSLVSWAWNPSAFVPAY